MRRVAAAFDTGPAEPLRARGEQGGPAGLAFDLALEELEPPPPTPTTGSR